MEVHAPARCEGKNYLQFIVSRAALPEDKHRYNPPEKLTGLKACLKILILSQIKQISKFPQYKGSKFKYSADLFNVRNYIV